MKKLLLSGAVALAGVFGISSAQAAVIDLGFSLDESGSVGSSNFNLTKNALADALALIPTSGANEYRVAVTTFSNGSTTVVSPTIITAANIAGIQDAVRNTTYSSGGTNTAGAINALTSLFTSAGLGATTLFNITTDGSPNSQTAAENAADAALAAGVDGISFEAVGSGINSPSRLAAMARIARPCSGSPCTGTVVSDITSIPNAVLTGFVIPVSDFAGYKAAIEAKITRIVDDTGGGNGSTPPIEVIPVPAGLPLLLGGLGLLGFVARRRAAA